MITKEMAYAGFWVRTGASLIDMLMMFIIIIPLMSFIYGQDHWMADSPVSGFWEFVFNYIFPAIAVILFWFYKSATPGKMVLKLTIVDAKTGGKPTTRQLLGRYLGYYVSMLPLFLGIFWIGFDPCKQGWHDKLAGTVVIRNKAPIPAPSEERV